MDVKRYRITCLVCKDSSIINIVDGKQVMYVDHVPIISCRFRGDLKWGFQCQCGNDSRLAQEELKDIDMLIQTSDENYKRTIIDRLTKSLRVKDSDKFAMERT